jgi:hypothetical protein
MVERVPDLGLDGQGIEMSRQRDSITLSCQLNTFDGWRDLAPGVAEWIDRAWNLLLRPSVPTWEPADDYPPMSEFGHPGGWWIQFEFGATAEASSMFRLSEARLREAIAGVRRGEYQFFKLAARRLDERGYPVTTDCRVELARDEETEASVLSLDVRRTALGTPLRDAEVAAITLVKDGALALRANYGMITLDEATGRQTPYETRMGIAFDEGVGSSRDYVRGYYWFNVLSPRHVEVLGGVDAVHKNAPCYSVEDLSDGESPQLCLQLSATLDDVTDQNLRRLRDYLAPVLLPGSPPEPYFGPPVRVWVD